MVCFDVVDRQSGHKTPEHDLGFAAEYPAGGRGVSNGADP
jgi:hypothetical protein